MARPAKLTEEMVREAIKLKADGLSNGDIVCALGVHESTFYRWIGEPKNRLQRELSEGLKWVRHSNQISIVRYRFFRTPSCRSLPTTSVSPSARQSKGGTGDGRLEQNRRPAQGRRKAQARAHASGTRTLLPDDEELWEWLQRQPNKAGYIKNLIRKDMGCRGYVERRADSVPPFNLASSRFSVASSMTLMKSP
ncbi:MAG: hypothetical protein ACI4B6_01765 [Atopobiaceae bacterium]